MDIREIAMIGAWALVGLFAVFGILFLAVTFFSREKVEKVKEAPVEQSYFSGAGVKPTAAGAAGPSNEFSFPSSRPAPANLAPGQLPPTLRAQPLSPQEILASITDDDSDLEALKKAPAPPMRTPNIVPPRDNRA